MPIDLNNLELSIKAVRYMGASQLVMRNSFTEQVESLHYRRGGFPDAHTTGNGTYCTPLWTVATPQLLEDLKSEKWMKMGGSVMATQEDFAELDKLSPAGLLENITSFVTNIKRFIRPHTSFGRCFYQLYNYELLIAAGTNRCIDDLGRYPTGGRCRNPFTADTIKYRITFNECEIQFFKSILNGAWDVQLFPQEGGASEKKVLVKNTLRAMVCNQLATEIISSKLIIFLNACGQLKSVISFSSTDLGILLNKALQANQEENSQILIKDSVSYLARDDYQKFLEGTKYTQLRFSKYFSTIAHSLFIPLPPNKVLTRCREITELKKTLDTTKLVCGQ